MEIDMEMAPLRTAIEKVKLDSAYIKHFDDLLKKIFLVLRPIIKRLNDTDFNLLIVLLRKDLFNPSGKKKNLLNPSDKEKERSYILEIYDRLENIIKKYEYLLDNKKTQQTSFLTRKEETEVLTCIRNLLTRERGEKRTTINTDGAILKTDRRTEEYRDKSEKSSEESTDGTNGDLNSVPFIPNKKPKRISLREYALKQGLNYETFRTLLRKHPSLANQITDKEIRGKKILYNVKDSPILSCLAELFIGYQGSKFVYSIWIKRLKDKKGLTKSGATKWMQRKIRNGVVPPEFFYCKTYLPAPVSEIVKLLYKIDESINNPVIPKEQWKPKDERKKTYAEINETLGEFERALAKFEYSKIAKAKKILEKLYTALGIPPKTYRQLISQFLSSTISLHIFPLFLFFGIHFI